MEEPFDGFPLLLLGKILWVRPQNAASVTPVPHGLQDNGIRKGFIVAHAITAFTAAMSAACVLSFCFSAARMCSSIVSSATMCVTTTVLC